MSRKSKTSNRTKNGNTPKRRSYRREYQARIAKGLAAGKSRSAARGHARAIDLPKPSPRPINQKSALERALAQMRRGQSQAAAAKAEGVSVESLRRHRLLHTTSQRQGNKWLIFDTRPQSYWVASDGKQISVTLANDEGTEVSAHWRAVDNFLRTNDVDFLDAFEGEGVRDVKGRFHQFETRPNVLRKLEAIGELNFIEIYADGGGV
jgi:hypothetical protein